MNTDKLQENDPNVSELVKVLIEFQQKGLTGQIRIQAEQGKIVSLHTLLNVLKNNLTK